MSKPFHPEIGIMADSHGDPEAIDWAVRFLRTRGCTALYHLGDICDTNRYATADACVARVRRHGIMAVKGNNDHSLAADARGRSNSGIQPATLTFLESLPLIRRAEGAEWVHSRPDVRRLGVSAMIGTIGQREATAYFRDNPTRLLFRGHSHAPEVICRQGDRIRFRPLPKETRLDLNACRPCMITCGALDQGFVMVWDPVQQTLISLSRH